MLKKFWNYQRLLNFSGGFDNVKKPSKLLFVITIIFAFILNGILNGGGVIFFATIMSLYIGYSIINAESRLFESVPVSKIYSFINLYSYSYLMGLFIIALGLIFQLPLEIFSVYNLYCGLDETYILKFINNWRAILLTGSISIIIVSILLPIFFIRINSLRKILAISVVSLATMGIISFKNTLPIIDKIGEINFLESIKIMNNYNDILLILGCICVVSIPISILISYKIYRGKRV